MIETFRILFVEDNARYQKVYATAIEAALPVTVIFATNGDDALRAVTGEHPPELIVLDLDIPGASGETVLEKVRQRERQQYIPIIILTGQGGLAKQMELLDSGADDFLEKGMAPEILIARLRTQIRHKLAIDRMERMAFDRDLFAAGVLSDIDGIRGAIGTICRRVQGLVAQDVVGNSAAVLAQLDDLSGVASKLGSYASDVIQSVRDTARVAEALPHEFDKLLDWVLSVLTVGETETARSLRFDCPEALVPVLADTNFLRLALLNIAQFALARGGGKAAVTVRQTQGQNPHDPQLRTFVTTRFEVPQATLSTKDAARLFSPGAAADDGGLGLALVAKVLTKMGGRAYAAPLPSGGIALCLELPAVAPSTT